MKKVYLFIFVLALGCQEAYDFCEVHEIFDDCSLLLPQDEDIPIDEQPMYAQSQACGGVGNTYGTQVGIIYYEFMSPQGDSIFWTRWKKQDDLTNDFNFFKAYFVKGNYDIDTVYITDEPNESNNFRSIVVDLTNGANNDEVIYESHQFKPFWYYSEVNFPNPISDSSFPVYTLECDGWAELGDTLYLTFN
tara:strand:- start:349 stop:921 length:573 start_codon:yes stop_codon:yes gene_type:complete